MKTVSKRRRIRKRKSTSTIQHENSNEKFIWGEIMVFSIQRKFDISFIAIDIDAGN